MTKLYMVRHDSMGIGFYSYSSIYYDEEWAKIECRLYTSIDVDEGKVDSESEILTYDINIIDNQVWRLVIFDGGETEFVSLYSTENEAREILQPYIDKGYSNEGKRFKDKDLKTYSLKSININLKKPISYEEYYKRTHYGD